jgi:hypothetical protein
MGEYRRSLEMIVFIDHLFTQLVTTNYKGEGLVPL